MSFLRNAWYVGMWADDLRPGDLAARRILGTRIVFFRTRDGSIAALSDTCPHRYAPLSLGKVLDGDVLQCPYHGLRFDASGACVFNPHGGGAIPAAARVQAFPVVERHSLVWIWMGERPPDYGAVPDFSIFDDAPPESVSKRDHIRMAASYELITENLLDLSHVSFLHDGILGNAETIKCDYRMSQEANTLRVHRTMRNVPVPGLFDLMFRRDGGRVDHWADMRWDAPGCLLNDTGVTDPGKPREEGTAIFGVHMLTPETETSTIYHFAAVRRNARSWGEPVDGEVRRQLSDLRRYAFEEQDRVIIDAQQRAILEQGERLPKPIFLEVDAGPIRFQRILKALIAAERASQPTGAPGQTSTS